LRLAPPIFFDCSRSHTSNALIESRSFDGAQPLKAHDRADACRFEDICFLSETKLYQPISAKRLPPSYFYVLLTNLLCRYADPTPIQINLQALIRIIRHTIAAKLVIITLFTTVAFACALVASAPAQSAVIAKDYVVEASQSNISPFGSGLAVLRVYNIDREWVRVGTNDTFMGIIKFSYGATFYPEYYSQISAAFYFSKNPYANIAYRAWVETSLINELGESINYYRTYGSDVRFHMGMITTSSGLNKGNVAGIKFRIKFDSLKDLNGDNPVFMRLSNLSYGPFKSMVSPVPEPSTWTMMLLDMTGVGLAMRRRQALASVAHV